MKICKNAKTSNPHEFQKSAAIRRSFEEWVSGPPYERDPYRWPIEEKTHAWPGQYKDIAVQLAWEAWCEAANDQAEAQCPGEKCNNATKSN